MNIIVAADRNWGIGNQNSLLVQIPRDQKFFREMTTGKVVVMGRKTLESLPQKQPLQNRTNIVLTKDKNYKVKGAILVHSIDELLEELKNYKDDDIYIVGGESVYRQMLPYCDTAIITKVHVTPESDTFFPNLDENPHWYLAETLMSGEENGITYEMLLYKRR